MNDCGLTTDGTFTNSERQTLINIMKAAVDFVVDTLGSYPGYAVISAKIVDDASARGYKCVAMVGSDRFDGCVSSGLGVKHAGGWYRDYYIEVYLS